MIVLNYPLKLSTELFLHTADYYFCVYEAHESDFVRLNMYNRFSGITSNLWQVVVCLDSQLH